MYVYYTYNHVYDYTIYICDDDSYDYLYNTYIIYIYVYRIMIVYDCKSICCDIM